MQTIFAAERKDRQQIVVLRDILVPFVSACKKVKNLRNLLLTDEILSDKIIFAAKKKQRIFKRFT